MKSNNLIRSIYDYEELAWTEGNLGNTERALKYILEAKKTALSINDTTILPEIEGQIAIHYLKSNSHKLADNKVIQRNSIDGDEELCDKVLDALER